ncbi:MAG: hypothetical protein RLZZ213_1481 [Cyanobacteriota bacterium]
MRSSQASDCSLLQQLSLRFIPPLTNKLNPAAQLTDGERR